MDGKELFKTSVRAVVEYVLREGDITPGTPIGNRFTEGIRGHREVQNSRHRRAAPASKLKMP